MSRPISCCAAVALAGVGFLGPHCARAQTTPGQIPNPATYQGSMQLQQQYDNQQQQFRQQQQQQYQQNLPQNEQRMQPQGSGGARAALGPDVVAIWRQRPSLAPEHNRLLGRWLPQAATVKTLPDGGLANLFGLEVMNMALGMARGVAQANCDQMFGRGPVEFRATTLVGFDRSGREGVLNRLAYRGNSDRVAVLPSDGGSIGVMLFDFNGPDRITVADYGCTFVRQRRADPSLTGAAMDAPSPVERTTASSSVRTSRSAAALSPGTEEAVLSLAAGIMVQPGRISPPTSNLVILLKDSAEIALAKSGFQPASGMSPLKGWSAACQIGVPACVAGANAIAADRVGTIRTDANGRARVTGLRTGTYYLFASARHNGQQALWNVRVDLQPGANSVTLDQRNAAADN